MAPKAIQIACYVVAILATGLGAYCLVTGRWGLAGINGAMVAVNLWLATISADIA